MRCQIAAMSDGDQDLVVGDELGHGHLDTLAPPPTRERPAPEPGTRPPRGCHWRSDAAPARRARAPAAAASVASAVCWNAVCRPRRPLTRNCSASIAPWWASCSGPGDPELVRSLDLVLGRLHVAAELRVEVLQLQPRRRERRRKLLAELRGRVSDRADLGHVVRVALSLAVGRASLDPYGQEHDDQDRERDQPDEAEERRQVAGERKRGRRPRGPRSRGGPGPASGGSSHDGGSSSPKKSKSRMSSSRVVTSHPSRGHSRVTHRSAGPRESSWRSREPERRSQRTSRDRGQEGATRVVRRRRPIHP